MLCPRSPRSAQGAGSSGADLGIATTFWSITHGAGWDLTDLELLVGADAFWRRARSDIDAAQRRLFVQAMTFEGDSVGLTVAAAVAASPAQDRRVLVDAYTRFTVSDRSVNSLAGRLSPEVRAEVRSTDAMFRDLVARGVGARVTNPVGPLMIHYPARNHKKLIVADDVAYIGGINFSDHNFAWRDFMLRLEGAKAADFLAADFEATFAGKARADRISLPELSIFSLDGRTNSKVFATISQLLATAREQIDVLSAYLTFPVADALAEAVRRGVSVRLITPLANNKPLVRDYLLALAGRAGFEVRLLPQMSHLKGMLIDNETLVVGSSNFDFVSLAAEEEFVAVSESPALIDGFRQQIIEPALADALPLGAHKASFLSGVAATAALRIADVVARSARNAPRGATDWPG